MSDFLVDLGANATARQVIKALGLPLPMPQRLARDESPWQSAPLEGRGVVVGAAGVPELSEVLGRTLAEAGASTFVDPSVGALDAFLAAGEAWGRPVRAIAADEAPDGKLHAVVLDGTGIRSLDDLRGLYEVFAPRLRRIGASGRCIVIGRPPSETTSVEVSAARRSLEGFVRSLAKEVGGKGITANLILVGKGRDEAAGPLVRWLLTSRSAFVDGQPLVLDSNVAAPSAVPVVRPLDGKVVIVTGAARGIGASTAATLAREGAHVLCVDRPQDAELLAETALQVGGTSVLADVTDPDAAKALLAAVKAAGGLHAVVHNAGITRDKTLANMDAGRWNAAIDVNLRAVITLTDALLPVMDKGGRIICLASVAGIAGNFGQTNYAASKAGVIGFVEALAPKVAKKGITVNAIAPGFIETRLTAAIPAATREAGRRLSALVQGGLPLDIAETVTFLATPGAYGMSGRTVRVCGGAFLGA